MRLSNQTLFQFEEEALEKVLGEIGTRFHLILGHGYQELDFVQIGAPKPDGDGYIGKTGNIMDEIRDITPDLVPVEETATEDVVTLKERLQRQLRDSVG